MGKYILVLLLGGFLFRLFLAFGAYDTLVFDSKAYSEFAKQLLGGIWPIDCCAKNVGYGAFLAIVYALFGVENIPAVRIVQIVLDLVTAGMIYAIAQRIFSKKAALLSLIVYLFNPFTGAFTGLVLAETVSIFLVVLLTFLLSRPAFSTNKTLWFAFGLTAGLLLFTRHSFYYFIFAFFATLALFVVRKIYFLPIVLAGFLLASSYSLVVNYQTFGKASFVPQYNLKYEILYLNFYRWHYPEVEFKGEHPMYREVVQGYWNMPLEEKVAHSEKYKQLLLARLPSDWPAFAANIGWNIVWLWDKDNLYTYVDRFYPADRWPMRIINIGLITLWAIGVIRVIGEKRKTALREPVFLFSLLLFAYITALFPLLSNESRHTLVYYPILSLWAGRALA